MREQNFIRNRNILLFFFGGTLLALLVFGFSSQASAITIEPIHKVLQESEEIKRVWRAVLNLVNGLIIAVLLLIAFANILRININNYGIKKFLPLLVLAVIAANFSYLFCRIFVDLANVVNDLLINGAPISGNEAPISVGEPGLSDSTAPGAAGAFDFLGMMPANVSETGKYLLITIGEFAGAIAIFILTFLFFIRNYLIYFLVALSPLAFMSIVLPQTKQVFNMWWSNFWKWVFLPTVSLFWLWVGGMWVNSSLTTNIQGGDDWDILSFVFAGVCYYLAITTPFKMGGGIMSAWGNMGKKVWGGTGGKAIGFGAAAGGRRAKLWWGNQLAGKEIKDKDGNVIGEKVGLIGKIGGYGKKIQDRERFIEEKTKDLMEDKVPALLARTDKKAAEREVERQKFGGEHDRAKKEVMKDYQETDAGKEWMQDRQEWLDELANIDKSIERNFNEAGAIFRESEVGMALSADRLRATQEALTHEDHINEVEKKILVDFFTKEGRFKDSEKDKEILQNRILQQTRNLTLDEMVKNRESKLVEGVFRDQMHIHNQGQKIEDIDKNIDNINAQTERFKDLSSRFTQLSGEERFELGKLSKLNSEGKIGDQAISKLNNKKGEVINSVAQFYQDKLNDGETHVENMYDRSTGTINGFDGIAAEREDLSNLSKKERKRYQDLGNIMMTRTGKQISKAIMDDVEKHQNEKTASEIADDLDPEKTTIGDRLNLVDGTSAATQVLENFHEGNRHLNDPESNREIEGRTLALMKVARQSSHAESIPASMALAQMLSDEAALIARDDFNNMIEQIARGQTIERAKTIRKRRIDDDFDAEQIRSTLSSHMSTQGRNRSLAFSAVTRQPTMGLSRNPGDYLSTVGILPDGSAGNQSNSVAYSTDTEHSVEQTQALINSMNQNTEGSFSKLSKQMTDTLKAPLGQIAEHTDEMGSTLKQERVHLAKDIAKELGFNLPQKLRAPFAEAIAQLPKNASSEQMTAQIQQFDPSFKGKIDQSTTFNITQSTTGGVSELGTNGIISKAQNIQSGLRGVSLMQQAGNVENHQPYIHHFHSLSPKQAKTQEQILSSALSDIENPDIPHDQVINSANEALRSTSFAVAGELPSSKTATINKLVMAQQAAQASVGAYSPQGKFDKDKATDNLVRGFDHEEAHKMREERQKLSSSPPDESTPIS